MSSGLSVEQMKVAEVFRSGFTDWNQKLILYGIGRNTEAILKLCPEIPIAGLMDAKTKEKYIWSLPVISIGEALKLAADIVIVARDSVIPIIYNRISDIDGNGCRVFHIDGTRLKNKPAKFVNSQLLYWKFNVEKLKAAIERAEHVSFDLFDTLVGRKVLHPYDLYKIVEQRSGLKEFANVRRKAEIELGILADLNAIYSYVDSSMLLGSETIKRIRTLEWEAETETLFLREGMKDIILYAKSIGKSVYLISDTYYFAKEIKKLLKNIGFELDFPILVSCEEKASKENGTLFEKYICKTGFLLAQCLHIGDNRYADIESAQKCGIQAIQVKSGYEMLENSAAHMLIEAEGEETGNNTLGLFVADSFCSPFSLAESQGYLTVDNLYQIGYRYVAPLVVAFIQWMQLQVTENQIDKVIFSARDGYVFQICYEILRECCQGLPKSVYLKTSRRCVSVAAIRDEQDIIKLSERNFCGTIIGFFRQRFGIEVSEEGEWITGSDKATALLRKYERKILSHAQKENLEYMAYLESNGISGDGKEYKYAFFDLIASGTVQYYFQKLLDTKLMGVYFATMNLPNAFFIEGDIYSAFGNILTYGSKDVLAKHYLMLESIFTDEYGTLICFENGHPVYAKPSNTHYEKISEIQEGIFDYAKQYMLIPHSLLAAKRIWTLLFDGSCKVDNAVKKCFWNDDFYDGTREYAAWV